MTLPTPLTAICPLDPVQFPFAVGRVEDGKIVEVTQFTRTLEDCYYSTQGYRAAEPTKRWIMVETDTNNFAGQEVTWRAV